MAHKRPEELRSQRWYPRLLIGVMAPLLLAGWIEQVHPGHFWLPDLA